MATASFPLENLTTPDHGRRARRWRNADGRPPITANAQLFGRRRPDAKALALFGPDGRGDWKIRESAGDSHAGADHLVLAAS